MVSRTTTVGRRHGDGPAACDAHHPGTRAARRRGFMVGVSTMTTCFAPAIAPTYGGVILNEFNWNQIFLFLVPVLACSFVTGIISIPQRRIGQRTGFKFKFMESHRYD